MNIEIKNYISRLLKEGKRMDGRKPTEYRDISIEYGVSETAEGSSLVKIGDTEVMAGVKLSLEKPYPDRPDEGGIMVNVELIPLASPEFEVGPPRIDAIELSRVIDRGIRESNAIDGKKLCVEKGEKVWMVGVDILPLNDAGNLQDAGSLAAIAALINTKFPAIDENGAVDYKTKTDKRLPLTKRPVEVTVFKIGDNFIVDPDTKESNIYDARLTVATIDKEWIAAMQKGGDGALTIDDIDKMVEIATEKGEKIRNQLQKIE